MGSRQWKNRVSDDYPHLASKAQAPQGRAFTLEVFDGVIQPDFMGFQETVERIASLQSKKLTQLRLRQPASLVFFQGKSLQGAAREIAPGCGEPLRDFVRDVQCDFHD